MGRLSEFRRKLTEIQARRAALAGTPSRAPALPAARPPAAAVPAAAVPADRGLNPILRSVLRRSPWFPGQAEPLHRVEPRRPPVALEAVCPGVVVDVGTSGRAYELTDPELVPAGTAVALARALASRDTPISRRVSRRARVEAAVPEDLLFVDIETTGLSNTPLFLIGILELEGGRLVARQYLARDYAEERAALELYARCLERPRLLVTFNGASFDLPYIRVRMAYHRLPAPPFLPHFDLLHEARRIWRPVVPNCRLTTLETHICGRTRHDDIEGALIPAAYHRFVRTGDAREIAQVVSHNALDLMTMADLMLAMPPEPDPEPVPPTADGHPPIPRSY